jgi:hypothetical protein
MYMQTTIFLGSQREQPLRYKSLLGAFTIDYCSIPEPPPSKQYLAAAFYSLLLYNYYCSVDPTLELATSSKSSDNK